MNKYPYWEDNHVEKSISKDLFILTNATLEDGLFYGSPITIVDSEGNEPAFRLMAQDTLETEDAGVGVYGMLVIEENAVNPCTITYTPRYIHSGEDHDYVAEQFEMVAGVDLSAHSDNIDDQLEEGVEPAVNASLTLGNFANTIIMSEALDDLTLVIKANYSNKEGLPEAIEAAYVNTKTAIVEDTLAKIRTMEVMILRESDITEDSLQLITSPPTDDMQGNYIFIVEEDVSFTYDDAYYDMVKGDICVFNQIKNEEYLVLFGRELKERVTLLNTVESQLEGCESNTFPTLVTIHKEIEEAVAEFLASQTGYYYDSLYRLTQDNIDIESIDINGTGILVIEQDVEISGDIHFEGDIVLVSGKEVTPIGVTEAKVLEVTESLALSEVIADSLDTQSSLIVELSSLEPVVADLEVPSKDNDSIAISTNNIYIKGECLSDTVATDQIRVSLSELDKDDYLTVDKVNTLLAKSATDTLLSVISDNTAKLNVILDDIPDGDFILMPSEECKSGFFYNDTPIVITDTHIIIKGVGVVPTLGISVEYLRFCGDTIYMVSATEIYRLDMTLGCMVQVCQSNESLIKNVVTLIGIDYIITDGVEDNTSSYSSIDDDEGVTGTVTGTILGVLKNTLTFVVKIDSSLGLYNSANNTAMILEVGIDTLVPCENGDLLFKDGILLGSIKDGKYNGFSYNGVPSAMWDGITVYHSNTDPRLYFKDDLTGYRIILK